MIEIMASIIIISFIIGLTLYHVIDTNIKLNNKNMKNTDKLN